MTTRSFMEILAEVEANHGELPLVLVNEDERTGMSYFQEVDASAVEINGKLVFALILSTLDVHTGQLQ